jgi:hypothetical protein
MTTRAGATYIFQVADRQYQISTLKVKPALKGVQILTQALLPAAAAMYSFQSGNGQDGDLIRQAIGATERLDELIDLCVPACKVDWNRTGNGWVPLSQFFEDCFAGDTVALLEWLFECLSFQYADFLAGNGLNALATKAAKFASRLGWIGQSGASQPTSESQTPILK